MRFGKNCGLHQINKAFDSHDLKASHLVKRYKGSKELNEENLVRMKLPFIQKN